MFWKCYIAVLMFENEEFKQENLSFRQEKHK